MNRILRLALICVCMTNVSQAAFGQEQDDTCGKILIAQIQADQLNETAFIEYIRRIDEATWDQKKKDGSFFGKLDAVFKGIPFKASADAKFSDFQEARRQYLERINYTGDSRKDYEYFRSFLTDGQVNAWLQCEIGKQQWGFRFIERDVTDSAVNLEIIWIHPPGVDDPVKDFVATIVGGKSAYPQAELGSLFPKDFPMKQGNIGVTVVRDPNTNLAISVSGSGFTRSYTKEAPNAISLNTASPIGTIIASLLLPTRYSEVTGDKSRFAPKTAKWVPADGRDVAGSKYAELIASKVPDLRGLFLRGVNRFDADAPRGDGKQDPDGDARRPGDYQGDVIAKHTHPFSYQSVGGAPPPKAEVQGGSGYPRRNLEAQTKEQTSGGNETRPKNVAVIYYVRIN